MPAARWAVPPYPSDARRWSAGRTADTRCGRPSALREPSASACTRTARWCRTRRTECTHGDRRHIAGSGPPPQRAARADCRTARSGIPHATPSDSASADPRRPAAAGRGLALLRAAFRPADRASARAARPGSRVACTSCRSWLLRSGRRGKSGKPGRHLPPGSLDLPDPGWPTRAALFHGLHHNEWRRFHHLIDLRDLVVLNPRQPTDRVAELLLQLFHPQQLGIGRTRDRPRHRSCERLNFLAQPRILAVAHRGERARQIVFEQLLRRAERGADRLDELTRGGGLCAGRLLGGTGVAPGDRAIAAVALIGRRRRPDRRFLQPILERRQLLDEAVRAI